MNNFNVASFVIQEFFGVVARNGFKLITEVCHAPVTIGRTAENNTGGILNQGTIFLFLAEKICCHAIGKIKSTLTHGENRPKEGRG